VQADPTKLRELLDVLRLQPREQSSAPVGHVLPPKLQQIEKPKTKLVVKSQKDYPMRGIPATLEIFQAAGVGLNRIDTRVLQLKNIRSIDLSNNRISKIPDCIKDVKLAELRLSGNRILEFPDVICSGELAQTLKVLDLARNELAFLPHKFPSLKSLVQLRLDCNKLQMLPRTFGKMCSLKFFSASNNQLVVLPPSFLNLNLESVDLFANPFSAVGLVRTCKTLSLPSLQELAGRCIKKSRSVEQVYCKHMQR
jgi:LRR-repeat protein 1